MPCYVLVNNVYRIANGFFLLDRGRLLETGRRKPDQGSKLGSTHAIFRDRAFVSATGDKH